MALSSKNDTAEVGSMRNTAVVYLSGPMSGLPEFNHPAFFEAEATLKSAGFEVFNPARNPAGLTEKDYMALAMVALPISDMIIALAGWESSQGAVTEIAYAAKLNLSFMTVDEAIAL